MNRKLYAHHEPMPDYMRRLSMMGARFIVGNDGTGTDGGTGSGNDNGSSTGSGESGAKPPWGDDENFDAEKAWSLIQNLRKDKEALTKERDEALGKIGAKDEQIEELQATVQLTDDTVKEKEKENAELSELRTKEGLLYDAGLDRKYVHQVVGDDEDAWQSSVQNLLELRGKAAQDSAPNPAQAAGSPEPSLDETANNFFGFN